MWLSTMFSRGPAEENFVNSMDSSFHWNRPYTICPQYPCTAIPTGDWTCSSSKNARSILKRTMETETDLYRCLESRIYDWELLIVVFDYAIHHEPAAAGGNGRREGGVQSGIGGTING